MCSSSLLVIITTGTMGCLLLMMLRVSNPVSPGMFSSRKTMSTTWCESSSKASSPLVTAMTL